MWEIKEIILIYLNYKIKLKPLYVFVIINLTILSLKSKRAIWNPNSEVKLDYHDFEADWIKNEISCDQN